MHGGSYTKMSNFANKYLKEKENENLVILDLGSQDVNGSYKQLFLKPNWKYIGCDMCPGKNVDLVLNDVYDWKEVESNSIDVVVSGQVFEHVEYIWNTIMEIVRVMKEGAICCIIAPAIFREHRYPVDCWRIYSDGFSALAKFSGLEILEVYTDWSNTLICDSVLICKKPILPEDEKRKLETKIEIMKSLSTDYEINLPDQK